MMDRTNSGDSALGLKWALQGLAASAEDQLALFPDFVCKGDELALEFENWYAVARHCEDWSVEQMAALEALDEKLTQMSRTGPDYSIALWADQGVRSAPEWVKIRELAATALAQFGWPRETPPLDPEDRGGAYVPGR